MAGRKTAIGPTSTARILSFIPAEGIAERIHLAPLLTAYPYPDQITAVSIHELDGLRVRHPEITFMSADALDLPFADGEFDLVGLGGHGADLKTVGLGPKSHGDRPGPVWAS